MLSSDTHDLQRRTIADFGDQWSRYQDSDGYYGSRAFFDDVFAPFLSSADVTGKSAAEIGAGSGRFVRILAEAGASHILAVEPSRAYDVLRANTADVASRITYIHAAGDCLPAGADVDYVFAIGVLHHIPDPDPVLRAARRALKPGGVMAVWLYGREGNGLYLLAFKPLWVIARRMPHTLLAALVWALYAPLWLYMVACRALPLPLAPYLRRVMWPLSAKKRRLVIYDQLNPAYAKYYTRSEAIDLLARNGFADVRVHHRHGYSWTVVGQNPEAVRASA